MAYFDRNTFNLIPDGKWEGALMEVSSAECLCAFCHETASGSMPFIPYPLLRLRKSELVEKPSQERDYFHRPYFYAHQSCALLCPEVYHSSSGEYFNVAAALHRGRSLKCSCCRRPGATVGCFEAKCERSYHASCTGKLDELRNGAIFWCPLHSRGQWDDRWNCDGCGVELEQAWFSCTLCRDYYNSFDLCGSCYNEQDSWNHQHAYNSFEMIDSRPAPFIESIDQPSITPGTAIDRRNGPAVCDIYSMDMTSTAFDIHNRAPRWATHSSADLSGTWIPQLPRWAILKYTQSTDTIVSNFLGRGTDAIEAILLGRKLSAVDVNKEYLSMAIRNCPGEVDIRLGDARSLPHLEDSSIQLILSHPPYYKCIIYSSIGEAPGDLSRSPSLETFNDSMRRVADESWRLLREGGRVILGIGDNRESRHLIPVTLYVLKEYFDAGFILEEFVKIPNIIMILTL